MNIVIDRVAEKFSDYPKVSPVLIMRYTQLDFHTCKLICEEVMKKKAIWTEK